MDVLSDVLRVVRLTGAVFFTVDFTSPWSVESAPPERLAPILMPGAECLILFHILARGECWVMCEGDEPVKVREGDIIVFPRGDPHVMTSRTDAFPIPVDNVIPLEDVTGVPRLTYGGGGEVTTFVCGYLVCDRRFNPLMSSLPTMMHVGAEESDAWLESMLHRMTAEAMDPRPGNITMLSRLTELVFIELLRRYADSASLHRSGWLAGLRDSYVGEALQLIHSRPEHEWTMGELSRRVGASRSLLAERFSTLIGESPMRYLTEWRMQLARQLLIDDELGVCEVAHRVGYESDAAFSRAFKRVVGRPPAAWRRERLLGS